MICDSCKLDRLVTEFIKNQKYCYHCVYQKKLEKIREKRIPKTYFCRICSKKFTHNENLKKNQRTIFCSQECAKKGHKQLINNYWTQ